MMTAEVLKNVNGAALVRFTDESGLVLVRFVSQAVAATYRSGSDFVDVDFIRVKKETSAARLVWLANGQEVWLPKSQTMFIQGVKLMVKSWLASKLGI